MPIFFGSDAAVDTTLLLLRQNSLDLTVDWLNTLFRAVEVDFENGLLYSIAYASNTVTITRYRIPIFDVGLNEKLDDTTLTLEDTTVLQCSTFKFYGSYTPYGIFLDGDDGYWYGFSNQANSSGNATMLWIKIKKSDLSFTEGSWTLSNAKLKAVGSFRESSSYPDTQRNAVLRNGYLYEMILTVHRWFASKSCPGDWMYARMGDLAEKVTKALGDASEVSETVTVPDPEKKIWDYLMDKIGNAFGAAGLMGNLYAESGLKPNNLQNSFNKKFNITDEEYTMLVDGGHYPDFIADKAGYGLAQWTFWSRKQALLDYAREKRKSIGDLQMQLDFMWKELNDMHPAVLIVLKEAESVREASDTVLLWYEKPTDQSEAMHAKRAGYGQGYYEKYAGGGVLPSSGGMSGADCPFLVRVTAKDLRIRKGNGTDTAWTGKYVPLEVYTIVEVKSGKGSDVGWGRLRSGAGWIALSYAKKV